MEPFDRLWILSMVGTAILVWWALTTTQELRERELGPALPEGPWR